MSGRKTVGDDAGWALLARAPEVEPIARLLAGSLIEPLMVFAMYVFTGIAAILSPFALTSKTVGRVFVAITWLFGMAWILLGLTLFYGHVGFFPYPPPGLRDDQTLPSSPTR